MKGKKNVLEAWKEFFTRFPDYTNHFETIHEKDSMMIVLGTSTCSNNASLNGPAIWSVAIVQGNVSEWRVYHDTPTNRKALGL